LRKSRTIAIGALGLAAALALTACSSGSGGGSSSSIGTPNGKGKTITVWSMTGDLSTPTLDAMPCRPVRRRMSSTSATRMSRASPPAAACSI
jgi:hypothetical protein